MLSNCLNPACGATFRYLHEGRVFSVDRVCLPPLSMKSGVRKLERYWLCSSCASRLRIVVENGEVVTRPLEVPGAVSPSSQERALSLVGTI
jgi:hypothetical protein